MGGQREQNLENPYKTRMEKRVLFFEVFLLFRVHSFFSSIELDQRIQTIGQEN